MTMARWFSDDDGDGAGGGVRTSVDPWDGHPLAAVAYQLHGLLQVADGVIDLVVDDGLVEIVRVRLLQDLRLLLKTLQGLVLSEWGEAKVKASQ